MSVQKLNNKYNDRCDGYLAVRILNVITPGLIKTFVDLMRIISHSH